MFVLNDKTTLQKMITSSGETVSELSVNKKVLIIFLRHLACIFCREALKDIKKIKSKLEQLQVEIVFVHMASVEAAEEVFADYDLADIKHISDRDKVLYQKFSLSKGDFRQLFGFKSFIGMGRAAVKGNSVGGSPIGDPRQLPGVFVVENGNVVNYFIYSSVGDYPNYIDLVKKSKK